MQDKKNPGLRTVLSFNKRLHNIFSKRSLPIQKFYGVFVTCMTQAAILAIDWIFIDNSSIKAGRRTANLQDHNIPTQLEAYLWTFSWTCLKPKQTDP